MPTLVVLGAGLGGLPLTHHVLKHTVPEVPDLRVVLVTPNSDWYLSVASVRGVVPGQIPDEKLFYPLKPRFTKYPAKNFEMVLGTAETLQPEDNSVIIATNDGGKRKISYDTLVVATGARPSDSKVPFKNLSNTEETKAALHSLQKDMAAAKTIVVAGGGSTGLETAGEIGFEYSQYGKKQVIFVHDNNLPLSSVFREDVRRGAINELEKLKVKVIPNTKVTSVQETGKGAKTLELTNNKGEVQTIVADVYLAATGTIPNSSYVPPNMLNSSGYIKQTTFLQAEGYKNIFVIGDVGSLENDTAKVADAQAIHAAKNLKAHFTGAKLAEYTPDTKLMMGITLGRSRATGQVGTMKIFSIIIWYFKGRYVGTDAGEGIASGLRSLVQKSL
jgi:apoptosis-inducing factor 2